MALRFHRRGAAAGLACALVVPVASFAQPAAPAAAQVTTPELRLPEPIGRIAWPTDAWDDRRRLQSLLTGGEAYPLLRSTLPRGADSGPPAWHLATPRLSLDWSGADPTGSNDGGMWSGRGASVRAVAGVLARRGRWRLAILPEAWATQNATWELPRSPFPVPAAPPGYSAYAAPWNLSTENRRQYPIDLPWRFGDRPLARVSPGESGLWFDADAVHLGLTTDHEWWGPSQRNPLVLGTNAEGIPRLAVRSGAPVDVLRGSLSYSYGLGVLSESPHFDTAASNDARSWNGLAVAWQSHAVPGLGLGAAHATVAALPRALGLGARALDVLGAGRGVPRTSVASLFVRYAPPGAGLEIYGEAGRTDAPASLRDLLQDPGHSLAYTVGLQRLLPRGPGAWRLQAEASMAEQRASFRRRPVGSWYTSRAVPQGYTQRGQVIGAPIGPGGSAQLLAVDYLAPRWQLGGYATRTRWNQDAFFAQSRFAPVEALGYRDSGWSEFDVSLEAGVRGMRQTATAVLEGSIAWRHRYNPYWRALADGPAAPRAEDISGLVARVSVVPTRSGPWTPDASRQVRGVRAAITPSARTAPAAATEDAYLAERTEWFADGDGERHARMRQLLGEAPVTAWGLRPLATSITAPDGVQRLRTRLGVSYNTGVPWGFNDGAVWQGRGATVAATGGFRVTAGPLHVIVAPTAFHSANRAFETFDGRRDCASVVDPQYPTTVDLPQRFGCAAYARLDPGQSEVRLEGYGVRVGVSSANQWWGPATTFPFLFSTNAPGVPRVFIGTTRGIGTGIGRLHGEVQWSRLDQSPYFEPTGIARDRRFGAGVIATFAPSFLPGLELGGARFFHAPWPEGAIPIRFWTRPILPFLKDRLPATGGPIPEDPTSPDGENQLASAFARWVIPAARLELYAEVGREDASADVRDLLLMPDQSSALLLGGQTAWRDADGRRWTARAEMLDHRARSIDRFRSFPSVYAHSSGANQGHTALGQLLGAATGPGSASGAVAGVERWDATGRLSMTLLRLVRRERFVSQVPAAHDASGLDVAYALDVERRLTGRGPDLTLGGALVWNIDRDFRRDIGSAQARVTWRF